MANINLVNYELNANEIPIKTRLYTFAQSGLKIGTSISPNKFSIQSGIAYFYIDEMQKKITFAGGDFDLPSLLQTVSAAYVYLCSDGTLTYEEYAPQSWNLDDKIPLGAITSLDQGSTLSQVFPILIDSSPSSKLSLDDGMRNLTETIISGIPNTLKLKINSGIIRSTGRNYFIDKQRPNTVNFSEQNPIEFTYINQEGKVLSKQTNIDTKNYDDNGVLKKINSSNATIQYAFISASGNIGILYGQIKYRNFTEALRNVNSESIIKPSILSGFMLNAVIVTKFNSSSFSDTTTTRIIPTNRSGDIGGFLKDNAMDENVI